MIRLPSLLAAVVLLCAANAPFPGSLSPGLAPLSPVTAQVVSHGSRAEKAVALSFDACSTRMPSEYKAQIIRTLIATRTPATIFLGGHWAEQESANVQALAANPLFELGNHSYSHLHMRRLSDQAIREELLRTQASVLAITGRQPRLFRAPFGEYDERLVRIAAKLGLTTIQFDLPSGDPDPHATAPKLVAWVLRKARPGSIIVMHLNHLKFHTAEALPAIIQGLRQRGFELVTVGELIRRKEHQHGLAAKLGRPGVSL